MARGNVGGRVVGLMLLAVILAAATLPGGIAAWLKAKLVNRPAKMLRPSRSERREA